MVNAIASGFFLSKQNRFLLLDEKTEELTDRCKKNISSTPMGRFGSPEELLGTMLYFLSGLSKFIAGTVIHVNCRFIKKYNDPINP